MTWPRTAWSASQGCVRVDSRPVNSSSCEPARVISASRNGWPAGSVPGGRGERHGGEPVALPLEGVGRQRHGAGAGQQRRPVGVDAVGEEGGDGGEQPVPFGPVAQNGGGEHRFLRGRRRRRGRGLALGPGRGRAVGRGRLGEGGEPAVGADLEEAACPEGAQAQQGVVEADRLPDMADPVLGVGEQTGFRGLSGDGGDDGHGRLVVGEARGDLAERVQHRVHERRVEGVTHAQTGRAPSGGGQFGGHLGHRVLGARNDHGTRAVDRGDPGVATSVEQRQHLVLGRLDREHRTTGGQFLHQPATRGHQGARVGEGEHPGHMRRGDLTDGVPGQEVRPHAPGFEEAVQRDLEGEEGGLGVLGAVHEVGVVPEHGLAQPGDACAHGVEGVGEHREGGVQFTAHAGTLGALPGEQEGGTSAGAGGAGDGRRQRGAVGEGAELGGQFVVVGADGHGAVREGGTGRGQGQGGVGRHHAGVRRHMVEQTAGLVAQRLRVTAADDPRHVPGGRLSRGRLGAGLSGGGFEDDVGVGAADPEGRHTRPPRTVPGRGPLPRLGEQLHRALVPVHVRGRRVHMQRRREHPVLHRQHHLHHARHTGTRLRVTHVGLHRPQIQRPFSRTVLPVGGQQRLRLDRVTQPRTRTVRLHGVHVTRSQPRVRQRRTDHPLLRRTVRRAQTVRRTVLVHRAAPHHREHRMPVRPRVRQPLHQQQTAALGEPGTVRRVRERLAPPVRRQTLLTAEVHEQPGRRHHGDTAGEGQVALPRLQRPHSQMQGDQGGRAGGVDGDGRAFEAEGVGQAARHDGGGGAVAQVGPDLVARCEGTGGVVLVVGAGEHAGAAAAQAARIDPGPLEGLPRHLQQQPLLRVHREGLARRDGEHARVEVGEAGEEAAGEGGGVAGPSGLGVVDSLQVPVPVLGEGAHHVGAVGEEPPELLGGVGVAGEAAGHADDHDGVLRGVRAGRRGGRGGGGGRALPGASCSSRCSASAAGVG